MKTKILTKKIKIHITAVTLAAVMFCTIPVFTWTGIAQTVSAQEKTSSIDKDGTDGYSGNSLFAENPMMSYLKLSLWGLIKIRPQAHRQPPQKTRQMKADVV